MERQRRESNEILIGKGKRKQALGRVKGKKKVYFIGKVGEGLSLERDKNVVFSSKRKAKVGKGKKIAFEKKKMGKNRGIFVEMKKKVDFRLNEKSKRTLK